MEQLGHEFETLSLSAKRDKTQPHCDSCMMACNMCPPPSAADSLLGDCIGEESYFDLKENVDDVLASDSQRRCCRRDYRSSSKTKKRDYPPPIPLLARTENLPSHMPWVLQRYYTSDGRLILKEEKVRHHEYLKAHRSNGRLTLLLVRLDDEVSVPPQFAENNENDDEEEVEGLETDNIEELDAGYVDGDKDDSGNDESALQNDDEGLVEEPIEEYNGSSGINGGNGGKCMSYSVSPSSSCFLAMPVPAIRPVHS